jgi:trans-2,3-dihydro-3-hydroxyanthranilate isomerase
MKLSFVTADVFTDEPFGGNPLAVFLDAGGLDPVLMQRIAREMSLSETVFVQPPSDPRHFRRLRIFTPAVELPFAGHPTVGTACVLAARGDVVSGPDIVLEEQVGPVPVHVARTARGWAATFAAAQKPEVQGAPVGPEDAARLLGLDPEHVIASGLRVASCGVPFLVVPVVDRAALGRCRVRLDVWERLLAGRTGENVYVVTRDAADADLQVRMFAPAMGIVEDPATGAAAAAIGGWLAEQEPDRGAEVRYQVAQGREMGRPSRLAVTVRREGPSGPVASVLVGGSTVFMSHGELVLP